MKLISYRHHDVDSYGLLTSDGVIDVAKRLGGTATTLKQCIATRSLERARAFAHEAPDFGLSEIQFLPVIPDPQHIVCIGLNYEEHRAETARPVANYPTIFLRVVGSLQGHQQPLLIPRESDHFDYEGELALIIGRTGRRIDEQSAWDYVAGVCCSNEGTVRDWQNHTHQFGPGKNFPLTGALGPALVTTDELPKNVDLGIETRVNGEVRQKARTAQMIFCVRASSPTYPPSCHCSPVMSFSVAPRAEWEPNASPPVGFAMATSLKWKLKGWARSATAARRSLYERTVGRWHLE